MDNIITTEDIYNNLNIDLASRLKVSGQANATTVTSHYIAERQTEIVQYIALHCYDGINQAMAYFSDDFFIESLKEAVLQQVKYVLDNGDMNYGGILMQNAGIQKLSMDERIIGGISPKAHLILLNVGLLYLGRV